MKIHHYMVGPIQTNCYFAANEETKELLVIDPGAYGKRLSDVAKENGYKPVAILLTHGHFDHTEGIADFLEAFPGEDIPVYAHEKERETLDDPEINLSGTLMGAPATYHVDHFVKDGEHLMLAGFDVEVLHTPGHTEGGCCFYIPQEKAVFCGDTLFCGSVGRTDFPGGSMGVLVRSIKEKLFTLPEDTVVYPGHDQVTTIGDEKKYNPFLQ